MHAMFHVPRCLCAFVLYATLAGCSALAPPQAPPAVFHDERFRPPAAPIAPAAIFAVDDAMRAYLHHEIAAARKGADPRRALFEALYRRDRLQLDYDAAITRTAAETFAARAGNCLSLAIMTAALARELGLAVTFQLVDVDERWSRNGTLYFSSNHVNLALERRSIGGNGINHYSTTAGAPLVVDFMPAPEEARIKAQPLAERTVVAMYFNNRAAELLAAGHVDDAYWAARQAIHADPGFLTAYNTLGVVYRHHGDVAAAITVLRYALERASDNTTYLSNLAQTLELGGHAQEAALLRARLQLLAPYPPFHFFNQGQQAMAQADYRRARSLFERELARMPDNHELHYWLALALLGLQEPRAAERHLQLAIAYSTSRDTHDLYAAKRARLRAVEQ